VNEAHTLQPNLSYCAQKKAKPLFSSLELARVQRGLSMPPYPHLWLYAQLLLVCADKEQHGRSLPVWMPRTIAGTTSFSDYARAGRGGRIIWGLGENHVSEGGWEECGCRNRGWAGRDQAVGHMLCSEALERVWFCSDHLGFVSMATNDLWLLHVQTCLLMSVQGMGVACSHQKLVTGSYVDDYKYWFMHNDPRHAITVSLQTLGAYSLVNCICNIWPSVD